MKNLIIIAAIGKNNELGKDNDLIWHTKEDMEFFRQTTTNHYIVMGRKTFSSLPKVLPNRTHIVLTRSNIELPNKVIKCSGVEEFLKLTEKIHDDIYIIGGSQIYSELINYSDKMILTEFDAYCESATAYFPKFNTSEWNQEIIGSYIDNNPKYLRKVYKRNK